MEHGAEHVHDHHTDPQDMMNMGGLRKKMPITFWTFLIGGFALSGFPFITAGFWSKDEIFADAWHHAIEGDTLAMVVFWMLAVAALLTAFYTMRQISLTFFGKPRTPLAEHAHESNAFMTIPLIGLAVFAVTAGWVGIPENFPVLGGILNNNYFHHFVGATVEETLHVLEEEHLAHALVNLGALDFDFFPLTVSLFVALGGLLAGYWVSGRKPLRANQPDPLEKPMGPLYAFLRDKWRWDELYATIFLGPAVWFSETFVYTLVDRGVIDGTLHLIARTIYTIGHYMKRFEEIVISDGVDMVKDWFLGLFNEARAIQTGKIQEYVLVSLLITAALAVVVMLINSGVMNSLVN
jgi:NADH-quinone oxidoreductase subunit L